LISQATIWKIESGQRPVRASELVALADSLGIMSTTSLTYKPDATRYKVELELANRNAQHAYATLKEAAAGYLEAQVVLVVAARETHDAGLAVTELHTSWLDTPAQEAVIQARVEADQEAERSEQVNDEINKILEPSAATATGQPCASKTSRSTAEDIPPPRFLYSRPTPRFASTAIDPAWGACLMSDFGSGMGAANLAQVRSAEVIAPRTRPLNWVYVS
jgi:hypothetical protein